ncbi:hypothetical protein B0H14DRAFT_3432899 [Mycena olivaceomarginata]|nr:hypothetical protein B0H14DRAFT_3432899 [Mycena olivaceomarginata]
MRFTTPFSALFVLVSVVAAATPSLKVTPEALQIASGITKDNCYGAPIPPWLPGSYPGWYYGPQQFAPTGLACLVDGLLCFVLRLLLGWSFCPSGPVPTQTVTLTLTPTATSSSPVVTSTPTPQVPSPPSGYSWGYTNYTCATECWPPELYITFGIVINIQACADMCTTLPACKFANCYHDVNAGSGKNNTTLFTCSLFTVVTSITNATNCGNQQQQSLPAGKTRITDSYALIKN